MFFTKSISFQSPSFRFGCVAFSLGLIGDCLNIFQGIYLVQIGWNEGSVGLALSLMGLTTLLFQTFAGDMIDKTNFDRRLVLSISCSVTAISALAILLVNDNNSDYVLIYITKVIQGLASTLVGPCLGALTLACFGPTLFDANMANNILCSHMGTLVTAILAGLLAYLCYPNIQYSFGVLGFSLLLALLFIRFLPEGDPLVGRGFHGKEQDSAVEDGYVHIENISGENVRTDTENVKGNEQSAARYWDVFSDPKICILSFTGLFFHFANANVLLVLGEMMGQNNDDGSMKRSAFPLIAGAITIAQLTMAVTTRLGDWLTQKGVGRKALFLAGLASLPVRCALIVLGKDAGDYFLMSTQVLDGIGGGFFALIHPYLVADITFGTGRFNVAMGLTGTCFGIGASLSNYLGQLLVEHFDHSTSLTASLLLSFLPIVLFGIFMPETMGLRGQIGNEISSKNNPKLQPRTDVEMS